MKNLLHENLAVTDLRACFARHALRPLFPILGDPQWSRVAANPMVRPWIDAIRELAWTQRDEPLPELTPAMYADFTATGQRLPFERVYFERRRRLARAMIAALVEPAGTSQLTLLESAVRLLEDIFAERAWALPAHVADPTGVDPMTIDLFGAETANLFAEAIHLFGTALSPDFQRSIRQRLRTEIFENYLASTFWWMTMDNNWNAVCHQGVLGAALAVCDDADLLARLFTAAVPRLNIFIASFGNDGSSSEGPGYWSYGFGWLCELNRQLEARTNGELSLFEGDAKIREIAAFGPRLTLSGGNVVNFSDCVPTAVPRASLISYLGERLNDPFINAQAEHAWGQRLAQPLQLHRERDDWFLLSRLLMDAPSSPPGEHHRPVVDLYFPDLQVIASRFFDAAGHYWEFAVKAGHNDECHNHNDIGSYLLNIDGHRLLEEIGAPEYTKAFFREGRYESIAARSLGHPVPLINGHEQSAGKALHGQIISHEFTDDRLSVEIDLTPAYPADAGCRRCIRRVDIDKRAGAMSIIDRFQFFNAAVVEVPVLTSAKVVDTHKSVEISRSAITLRIVPIDGTRVSGIQNHSYSDHDGDPASIQRIVLVPTDPAAALVGYRLTLASLTSST